MKLINEVGNRYGKWTVITRGGRTRAEGRSRTFWLCRCDCGATANVDATSLRTGGTGSCGCNVKKTFAEEIGKTYGRWLVLSLWRRDKRGAVHMLCRCQCGTESVVKLRELRQGNSRSCGCIQKLPKGDAVKTQLILSYKRSAARRKYEWSLTDEQANALMSRPCWYCGREPAEKPSSYYGNRDGSFRANGIDRRDNEVGYTQENCVPCCKICNFAKHRLSEQEFYEWVRKAYQHCDREGRFSL